MSTKVSREDLVKQLIKRDGLICQYPGAEHALDLKATGKQEVTIDHWKPQSWARENGWTEEEIWALSNLKLMCKKHNALKSDLIPREDGTIPERPQRTKRLRRERRAERNDICDTCYSGRLLLLDETCPDCGSGPQPTYPTAYQVRSNECPHEGPWSCWACIAGHVDRKPAYIDVFDIEGSGIDD